MNTTRFAHARWFAGTLVCAAVVSGCSDEKPTPREDGSSVDGGSIADDDASDASDGSMENGGDSVCDEVGAEVALCDDFGGNALDLEKWWYGRRHWGPQPPRNHGVVPENVSVHDGRAFIAANGDRYTGAVQGIRKDNGYHQDQPGTRSGGVLVSDEYYGSGRYEVRMRLPASTGVVSAIWTFHYREHYQGTPEYEAAIASGNVRLGNQNDGYYVIPNHEIDIEVPTSLEGQPDAEASYSNARYNTWIGETGPEYTDEFFDNGANLSDGEFHVWRFDWHTGDVDQTPRVEFYVDGVPVYTSMTHIPFVKGRLTIGTWFAEWAGGAAPFDVEYLEIDWVKVTPFSEASDEWVAETYPDDGLTKCASKEANDASEPQCKLVVY
jgi:beta-glucanase (GH16 family)